MKTLTVAGALPVILLLAGCASSKVPLDSLPAFGGASLGDQGTGKKLILKFSPETPQFQVMHNKEIPFPKSGGNPRRRSPFKRNLYLPKKAVA